jgi:hypothetical protein
MRSNEWLSMLMSASLHTARSRKTDPILDTIYEDRKLRFRGLTLDSLAALHIGIFVRSVFCAIA